MSWLTIDSCAGNRCRRKEEIGCARTRWIGRCFGMPLAALSNACNRKAGASVGIIVEFRRSWFFEEGLLVGGVVLSSILNRSA